MKFPAHLQDFHPKKIVMEWAGFEFMVGKEEADRLSAKSGKPPLVLIDEEGFHPIWDEEEPE